MMILQTGSKTRSGVKRGKARGFTLIEFILVMTLLLVVFGVSMPTLSNFFRGRSLDAEARRFVALTRYAQSRAVSESLPMILWIDAKEGRYGLEREYGYERIDPKEAIYDLDPELKIEAIRTRTPTRTVSPLGQTQAARRNLPMIRFQPDGFISVASVETVVLEEAKKESDPIYIMQSRNRLGYEIQTNIFQIQNYLR